MEESAPVIDNMAPILIEVGALALAVVDVLLEQPTRVILSMISKPRKIPKILFTELPPFDLFINAGH